VPTGTTPVQSRHRCDIQIRRRRGARGKKRTTFISPLTSARSATVAGTANLVPWRTPRRLRKVVECSKARLFNQPAFIQNFVFSIGDYSDIVQMAPGTFRSAQRTRIGRYEIFYAGLRTVLYKITCEGFLGTTLRRRTNHGALQGRVYWKHAVDRSHGDATVTGPLTRGGHYT